MHESTLALKPLLIIPTIPPDQHFICEYIAASRFGQCLKEVTADNIQRALDEIEKQNGYKTKLETLNKRIKIYHGLKERTIGFWIDYLFEVGSVELSQQQYQHMNVLQILDLDIHFLVFAILLGFLIIIQKIFTYICCSKKKVKRLKID